MTNPELLKLLDLYRVAYRRVVMADLCASASAAPLDETLLKLQDEANANLRSAEANLVAHMDPAPARVPMTDKELEDAIRDCAFSYANHGLGNTWAETLASMKSAPFSWASDVDALIANSGRMCRKVESVDIMVFVAKEWDLLKQANGYDSVWTRLDNYALNHHASMGGTAWWVETIRELSQYRSTMVTECRCTLDQVLTYLTLES